MTSNPVTQSRIENRILTVRGVKVIVDADLALLYGVPTKRLNEQVKRNSGRFPVDFMFQLSATEKAEVVAICDHLQKLKFSKSLPCVLTEHGAIQAANVLNSPQAVEMGVYVVRAFVQLREALSQYREVAKHLDDLEHKTELLALHHDTLAHNSRAQFKRVFDALRELMAQPDNPPQPKQPIGFTTPSNSPNKNRKRLK
ncbi:MAG: ORF6N domain-containing protein [Betaproteobacteria bacterium]|nr:ORF6N domain-containing protein [Betaproteobacteria bacterium]